MLNFDLDIGHKCTGAIDIQLYGIGGGLVPGHLSGYPSPLCTRAGQPGPKPSPAMQPAFMKVRIHVDSASCSF